MTSPTPHARLSEEELADMRQHAEIIDAAADGYLHTPRDVLRLLNEIAELRKDISIERLLAGPRVRVGLIIGGKMRPEYAERIAEFLALERQDKILVLDDGVHVEVQELPLPCAVVSKERDERVLWSSDPKAPNERLRVEQDIEGPGGGLVYIVDEVMPHRGAIHADPVTADVVTLTPTQARWLRDQLNTMWLGDAEADHRVPESAPEGEPT